MVDRVMTQEEIEEIPPAVLQVEPQEEIIVEEDPEEEERSAQIEPEPTDPALREQQARIEEARREKEAHQRAEEILATQRERLEKARGVAEETGISVAEAKQALGYRIPEYKVEQAKQQRLARANAVEVGVQTSNPVLIENTEEVQRIQQEQPKLYQVLRDEGIESFNKAVAVQVFTQRYEYKKAQEEIARVNRERELEQQRYEEITAKVSPYTQYIGQPGKEEPVVDVSAYLRDNPQDRQTLKALGLSNQEIADSRVYNAQLKLIEQPEKVSFKDTLKGISRAAFDGMFLPYIEAYQRGQAIGKFEAQGKLTQQDVFEKIGKAETDLLLHTADLIVPGFWARRWNEYSPAEKAINIALDALVLLPVIKMAKVSLTGISKGAAVKQIIKTESKITKTLLKPIEKTYGKEFATKFRAVSKAQTDYLKSLAKLDRVKVKGATKEVSKQIKKVINSGERLRATSRQLKGVAKNKMGFDSPSVQEVFNRIDSDIVDQAKAVYDSISKPKGSVKSLRAEVTQLQKELAAAKEKYPTDPTRWTQLVIDTVNKEAELKAATRGTSLQELQNKLVSLRNELAGSKKSLKKAPRNSKEAKRILSKYNKTQSEISKIQTQLDRELKNLDVEWGRGGGLPRSGKTVLLATRKPRTPLPKEFKEFIPIRTGGGARTAALASAIKVEFDVIGKRLPQEDWDRVVREVVTPDVIREITTKDWNKLQGAIVTDIRAIEKTTPQGKMLPDEELKERVKEAVQSQVMAQAITETVAKTEPVTKAELKASQKSTTKTRVGIKTTPDIKVKFRIIPTPALMPVSGAEGEKQRIPLGSLAWKQGIFWKYIPPPYNQTKPITLPRGISPIGADLRRGSNSPFDTIQKIGESSAKVPESIAVDLGVADLYIINQGRRIEFIGKGQETNVGTRLDSPTMGMAIGDEEIGEILPELKQPYQSRIKKAKSKKRRGLTEYEYMTSLKGFRF